MLPRLLAIVCAILVLPHGLSHGAGQGRIISIVPGPADVTLTWQETHPPYLVQTSSDLFLWCDQGALRDAGSATLAAEQSPAFYRVRYLNTADELGAFYGLIETEQGESGALLGRHRLKSRWWFYRPKGATSPSPAEFFRNLFVFYQHIDDGAVATFAGRLETLGTIATPGDADILTVSWTTGSGKEERRFMLTLDFPYDVHPPRMTEPLPSDPYYTLECRYATAQPELDIYEMKMGTTTMDRTGLAQLAQPRTPPPPRDYAVAVGGVEVTHAYEVGVSMWRGMIPDYVFTYNLYEWTAPSGVTGARLPAFQTDSYFSRTLLPHHHNFVESALIEPGMDPALSEATRDALRAANIRYVYTLKDLIGGMSPDDIRFIGFDDTIRQAQP